jgi:hypothetical protein
MPTPTTAKGVKPQGDVSWAETAQGLEILISLPIASFAGIASTIGKNNLFKN